MKRFLLSLLMMQILHASFGQYAISENKRYLLKDGKPFFWLGDTAWELFHRLNREEADQYLKRRAEQGFTVIQAVALAELDGLRVPNAYGDLPLHNEDAAQPNEAYFKHVDYIIDKAASYGLTVALLPTWGDKLFKDSWGKGPEIFTEEKAAIYGKWIGKRYRDKKNIIWVMGGDRNPRNESDMAVWRSMARAVIEGIGDAQKPLLTFHPQPSALGSATWFAKDDWISFHMFQIGHCRDIASYEMIRKVYDMVPDKPVMDGEPIYEDHPVCFNAKDLGTSNAYDVRKAAWIDLFAGSHGHTYGCHGVWQFYSEKTEGINGPHFFWKEALELPGANQMKYVRKLMESFSISDRVPDQSILLEPPTPPSERIQATRGKDYALIYTAAGKSFTVNAGKLNATQLKASWYDPRNGESRPIGSFGKQLPLRFDPPTGGYGQDWVLVLDGRN